MTCSINRMSCSAVLASLLIAVLGCASSDPSSLHDAADARGKANQALDEVEAARNLEAESPQQAKAAYEKILAHWPVYKIKQTGFYPVSTDR